MEDQPLSNNLEYSSTSATAIGSGRYARVFKRPLDLVAASLAIAILTPLLILISLAIWWLDGRPIFFRQERVGMGRKPFRIWKFRTMSSTPESGINPAQCGFSIGDNSRVTALGKVLRRCKFDELPQFFNVLSGDMSLVGPRPEVLQWTQIYPDKWAIVLRARPGITDPASIEFRDESRLLTASADPEKMYELEVLPRKLDLNISYVRDIRGKRDLMIIVETIYRTLYPKNIERRE